MKKSLGLIQRHVHVLTDETKANDVGDKAVRNKAVIQYIQSKHDELH